jgi:signal transduction histidine kinase/CheY-like chemotaxis protein
VDPLVLVAELLFVFLFGVTLVQYVRRRDPVSRALALTFVSVTLIFAVGLLGRVVTIPAVVTSAALVLFFLQPVFTLHLVSLVRHVPRAVQIAALVVILVTLLPVLVLRPLPPILGVAAVAAFGAVDLLAAVYLLFAANRRRGPIRARLTVAAASTALFAVAILSAVARSDAGSGGGGTAPATAVLALLAAVGYVIAFVPPGFVQRVWQAGLAVEYVPALIADAGEPVATIWQHFASMAASMYDGAAVVVLPGAGGEAEIAASARFPAAMRPERVLKATKEDLDTLVAIADKRPARRPAQAGAFAERLADTVRGRFVRVIAIPLHDTKSIGALAIVSSHLTLFHPADLDLLGSLGSQTAIVAERRAMFAEQEGLAQRLAASVEALQSASKAKSDFLASMSHELRTPLSAILGFSELMRLEPRADEKLTVPADWVDHIHRGGEHLLSLINDVLDLSKVEAGRLELRPETFDLATAVAESLAGLRPLAERKRIGLIADVPPLDLTADRGRFRQVLYNLLSNAIKYTPDGGTVRVDASGDHREIRVAVTDNGIGIRPEDHAAVFEEFRQVGDPTERQPGTGLGLALTRRLVEAHGGRVELTSARGKGSRFTTVLPATATAATVTRAAEPHAPRLPQPSRGATTVLVIEDDPSAVRLLREYLEPAGYEVRVAADGPTGIANAKEVRPAAVVLDVLLPGIDGWEVLRRMKADATLRDVPVIMLTVVDERDVGLALGAVDYLVKPINRDTLLTSLSRFAARTTTPDAPLHVLAVDDEPAALELIRATLASEGFAVTAVSTGREALDAARHERFDFVVCDLVMPDLDGFDVIAALKSDPQTAATPILVCTGRDLTARDKQRLNGQILGIASKGTDGRDGLRAWLTRASRTPDGGRTRGAAGDALTRG